jgi:hypothetical protein
MEMDRLTTLLEKFRVTAPHDKTRTMADVVEELARIVNDLDRRLKAIEDGESASATSKECQEPHKPPENEFAFKPLKTSRHTTSPMSPTWRSRRLLIIAGERLTGGVPPG